MSGHPNRARHRLALLVVAAGIALAGAASAGTADPDKILRVASPDIEPLDPHQYTDDPSFEVLRALFEGLYEWDYLAMPAQLSPVTAAALPAISADGRTWTIRVQPGIHFVDDPAFGGKRREPVAADCVYSLKR